MSASRRRLAAVGIAAAAVLVEATTLRRRGYGLAGDVVVRCRRGHLFATIWVPGASLKSVRLGPWRVQRCPVGGHWSVVSPVDAGALTDDERRAAAAHHDIRIP
jgi:hypothetical protein